MVQNHNVNIPMQYTAIFHGCKNDDFQWKLFDYFHTSAQNMDCGYTLEPPQCEAVLTNEAVLTSPHTLCLEQK